MNLALKEKNPNEEMNNRKVDNMLSIMNQLCAILKRENQALEKNKVREIERLVDPKSKVINVYAEQYQAFASNPGIFDTLDSIRKKEVSSVAKILQSLMEDNERLLKANMAASKRLIDTIVESAKKQEREQSGVYSSKGSMGYESASKKTNMAFNQVL